MDMRLLLIEGLPGTGKTTLASHLCASALNEGRKSRWYLEEAADHPVHPHSLGALKSRADYPSQCLQRWQRFVDEARSTGTLHILEGSAFQSTVRFMMEQGRADIDDYIDEFEKILAPLSPSFIYLRPENAEKHLRATAIHRGPGWTRKVAVYIEQTPYARSHGLRGESGMHRFWADYAGLCDALVNRLSMPLSRTAIATGPQSIDKET